MKKTSLLKTMLLLCALIVGSSSAWAADPTITITRSSFSGSGGYETYDWTADGISGKGQIYATTTSSIQMNGGNDKGKFIYNTTAIPGSIKKINLVKSSGSNRAYSVYGRTTAYSGSGEYGTLISTANIQDGTGRDYTVTTGDYSYFVIVNASTSAAYLASITITYTVASYTITAVSNNDSYGIVSVTGSTITANPKSGYRVKAGDGGYTVTSGTATVTNNGDNTFTVSASSNCTIRINFEEIPTHKATFSVDGKISTSYFKEGATIEFPTSVTAPEGYTFLGWTATALSAAQATAPNDLTTSAIMGTIDVVYYAVFAIATGGGDDTYEKLTSQAFDENATYVIGATQSSTDNTMWYLSSYEYVDKNSTWGEATKTPNTVSPIKFKLTGTASALVVQDEAGNFLAPWKTNFRMVSSSVTCTLKNNGTIYGISGADNTTEVNLRHNYNGGNGGIRWYDGSTGTSAYFFKVVPSITYSDYCTTVTTSATITLNEACTDGDLYYGTYSSSRAFKVPSDLIVSEISVIDGSLFVEHYQTAAVVPANTGVMVSSDTPGDHNVTLSSESGTSVLGDDNMLKPSGDAGISADDMDVADTKFYRLTMHNGTQIGFWWGAENGAAFALAANKAYLAVPNGGSARGLWFNGEDVTAINDVKTSQNTNGNYFDLQGRKVVNPTKGLYIVNGKKVIVK